MALINTAGILAGRGFRVLVIDLDLEAPGFPTSTRMRPTLRQSEQKPRQRPLQLGFVDLLIDAKERGQEADLFALSVDELAEALHPSLSRSRRSSRIQGWLAPHHARRQI